MKTLSKDQCRQIKDLSAEELSRFAEWIAEEYDILSEDEVEKLWDECLDEYPVNIAGLKFSASYALQQLDPTAYRCGFSEFTDGDYYDLCDYSLGDGWIETDPEELLEDFMDQVLLQYHYIVDVVECPIYRMPCTLTGLDAELDNCEEGSYILERVRVDDPLTDGCDRFVSSDGVLFDCSIDSYQWAEWFRLDHLIEADSEEEYPEDGAE